MPGKRALLTFIIGACLGVILLWQLTLPLKERIAERYVHRGDTYLLAQDFESAAEEYKKAERFEKENPDAIAGAKLAQAGPTSPADLEDFYRSHNADSLVAEIETATAHYDTPKAALQAGVDLYKQGKFGLARYPMEQAVAKDEKYPEAWHYLGLDYQELAKTEASYRAKAEEAWEKRDTLTPAYLKTE